MKTIKNERRVYVKGGYIVVCFDGRQFVTSHTSAVDATRPVSVEVAQGPWGGEPRVAVQQSDVQETWRPAPRASMSKGAPRSGLVSKK